MLGIVVSQADSASVHIGEELRTVTDWEEGSVEPGADAGAAVYRTEGATIREFDALHLELERPAAAFDGPSLLVFASRHAGDTGPLLTAHHTGNIGPAEHGGEPNVLARACPNAHARVVESLCEYAPEGYDVGMECTHHGPSTVGAPSMFVELGSGPDQWEDRTAARAVARAILDLRGISPDRDSETDPDSSRIPTSQGSRPSISGSDGTAANVQESTSKAKSRPDDEIEARTSDRYRRHLVGVGGGHYAPRFTRVLEETDWAFGHIVADWGLETLDTASESAVEEVKTQQSPLADILDQALTNSRASYALVDGNRQGLAETVETQGYRAVTETWVRETDAIDLEFVAAMEEALGPVEDGLRFGKPARESEPSEWVETSVPGAVLDEAYGINHNRARGAVAEHALAFGTAEGGSRPTGPVVLPDESARTAIIDALVAILETNYDDVEHTSEAVIVREEQFDPDLARTLGVPEGPAFGRLSDGNPVEVGDEMIPPDAVTRERERRLELANSDAEGSDRK